MLCVNLAICECRAGSGSRPPGFRAGLPLGARERGARALAGPSAAARAGAGAASLSLRENGNTTERIAVSS